MKARIYKRTLSLYEINRRVREDPVEFIREEEEAYSRKIDEMARYLAVGADTRRLVMLSGPSSSGKTTTALILRDKLRELGVDAHAVSMDDFYRGREQAPRLEDGSFDYETIDALRLETLETCMRELIQSGRTQLPQFDFHEGKPLKETRELCIRPNSVVIFEGIHAINPLFERHLPADSLLKVFVNTVTPVYEGDDKLLARRDIRLTRRMLRDERFRNSPVSNTLLMWPQVIRGENTYMFPYVDTVDYLIDTTHAYEPCLFAPLLLPSLKGVPRDHPEAKTAAKLCEKLSRFEPLPLDALPKTSLLREFVGDGAY